MSMHRYFSTGSVPSNVPEIKVTTHHGALLRSITEVDLYLKETIQMFSDCLEEREEMHVNKEEEEVEQDSEAPQADNLEYWQQIKDLLIEIANLTCEVDTISCHCRKQNCPFRKANHDPLAYSPASSPSTSPVLQKHQSAQLKANVSYGGFEPMMQSSDVEYDHKLVEVESKKEPLIRRNRRHAPVRRKKNTNSLALSVFECSTEFRDRSLTLPDIRRSSLAV